MIVELFITLWIVLILITIVCGFIWYFTNEDIFGIIALISGLLLVAILLIFLSALAEWSGQAIKEWSNTLIR